MAKTIDDSGFWIIKNNPISKEGVFPYLGENISPDLEPKKIYMVYRPVNELNREETIESFDGVPFIDNHEMIGEGFTPYDERPAGGVLMNPRVDDGVMYGDFRIFSEDLKDKIVNGKKELSLGYLCNYEIRKGVWNGQTYDAIQTNLRGNHIALVENARMGHDCKVYDNKTFATDSLSFDADDKDVQWITTENGAHIPIKNGQSKEEAVKEFFDKKSSEKVKYKVSEVSGMFKSDKIKKHIGFDLPEDDLNVIPKNISEAIWLHEQNNHYDEDIEIPEKFKDLEEVSEFINSLDLKNDKKEYYKKIIDGMKEKSETYYGIKKHFENPPKGENIDSYGNSIKNPEIFKKWFGGSKAKDKNGNPIVLFHGSKEAELKGGQFDFKHKGESQNKQNAFFANTREDVASGYTGEDGKLHKVFLKIEKPLIVDFKGSSFLNGGYEEFEVHPYGEEKSYRNTTIIKRRSGMADAKEAPVISKIVNYAKKNGYDGVIAKNISDAQKYESKYDFGDYSDDYIVFDPEKQIKSIDNEGSWSGKTIYDEKEIPDGQDTPKKDGEKSPLTTQDEGDKMADKREAIRKVMAIAAKPNSDFEGGEEEKVETIAKILEASEYAKSEAGTANDESEKDEDKKTTEDKCGKDEDEEKEDKKTEDEDETKSDDKGTEDEDDEDKKDDKKSVEDSANLVLREIEARSSLKASLAPLVGEFACDGMTSEEIAVYGCKKLGLQVAADEAKSVLKGFLAAQDGKNETMYGFRRSDASVGMDKALQEYLK